jgi:hypothetical protein
MMPFQRVRDAVSRARNTSSNGPRRVQGTAPYVAMFIYLYIDIHTRPDAQYTATHGPASMAGDMMVSRKSAWATMNSRWHRG